MKEKRKERIENNEITEKRMRRKEITNILMKEKGIKNERKRWNIKEKKAMQKLTEGK